MATQYFGGYTLHASTSRQNLRHNFLTGLAILKHPDDTAYLPLNAAKPHLQVRLRFISDGSHLHFHLPSLQRATIEDTPFEQAKVSLNSCIQCCINMAA